MLDHPNIVRCYEFFEDGHNLSQIIELISGGDLQGYADAIHRERKKALDEVQIASMMKQLFRCLCFMHSKQFAHKDLKPENVMITGGDHIKVIDFGLAEWFEH